jgi:signal transduction histidine kinase/CheY-like chemotaxis protein/HAMP domain-containing protein
MIDSIRARLITTFMSLAVIPLVLLGVVLIWQNYIVEIDHIKKSQQLTTELTAENISTFLYEQEHKILTLIKTYYLPDLSVKEQKAQLSKFLSISKDYEHGYVFDNIILLDANGQESIRVSRTHLAKTNDRTEWSNSELFSKPISTGSIYHSPVFFSDNSGEPVLNIGVPIVDLRTLEPKGVLIAEMRLKFLWHRISILKIGSQGTAYLTDLDGRVVVHPNRSMVLRSTKIKIPDTSKIMAGLNGEQALVVAHKILFGNLPLYFVTEIPKSEAFQHIYYSIYILGIILLLTLICSAAIIFIVVRQIVQPLESLAVTARDISRGDYSKRAKPLNITEFRDLSKAFNSMTGRLHETIENLESQIDFVENVFESLSHPLYVIDAQDYTVKMANTAANFGILTSDSKCHMLTHNSDTPCGGKDHPCSIEEIKKTGKPVMMQHMHCAEKDGTQRMFEVYGYPIFNLKGDITQVIEYNIDVTEKKNLEDQLRQAQKLEAIGSLASGVAHDFNNLLTTILGYGELSLMELGEDDPMREKLEAIYEAGQKASTLTRQLLAFSRKQVLEMRVINLNSLLDNLKKMLSRMIRENVKIRMLLEPSAGNIMADPGQIEQIVMNLAINARDAISEGGLITIETQKIDLDEEYCKIHVEAQPGSYAALYVTDNGKGMLPEVMEKIFDPFYTTKEKGAGTGLGLSTVYGIVKQHNGHIYVYSELGNGSTFKIYFPQIKIAADKTTKKVFPAMEKGAETILVADDETSIRKLVRDSLEPLGYKILEASDGKEALEIFRRGEPQIDMLLTDVIMPEMTGKKLAEILLAEKPGFKVLYMSGYTDDVIANQGVLDEDIEFINKPLVPSLLTKKIREVLAK